MASFMNELPNPPRFDGDPNSPKAAKFLKHWWKVFTDFLEMCEHVATAQDQGAPNRLQVLVEYVSAEVYEIIDDCTTYDEAISRLKRAYIKSPNSSFATGWRPGNRSQRNACERLCKHYSF